jgi:hypothetical protein
MVRSAYLIFGSERAARRNSRLALTVEVKSPPTVCSRTVSRSTRGAFAEATTDKQTDRSRYLQTNHHFEFCQFCDLFRFSAAQIA